MTVHHHILILLDEVLGLGGKSAAFNPSTPLLGAIPGLDSMAVITLVDRLEDHFDIRIDDVEIDGSTFATVGSLTHFIESKVSA